MKLSINRSIFIRTAFSVVLSGLTIRGAEDRSSNLVQIEKGSAAFDVTTNVPGVEVKGKSSMLAATAVVQQDASGLIIEQIKASLPVSSLTTGMKLRDEHMRKYIFVSSDGQEPDVQFEAERALCAGTHTAHEFDCEVSGNLALRGTPRPLEIKLHVKEQGGSSSEYHAAGNGVLQLTDYGIQPPSQFGVKTSNQVRIHLEFTGKVKSLVASNIGDRR